MRIEELNKKLKPHLMRADILNRPGYGLDNLAGEFEVWVEKFSTPADYRTGRNYVWYSKMGIGETLERAMDRCIEDLRKQGIEL